MGVNSRAKMQAELRLARRESLLEESAARLKTVGIGARKAFYVVCHTPLAKERI